MGRVPERRTLDLTASQTFRQQRRKGLQRKALPVSQPPGPGPQWDPQSQRWYLPAGEGPPPPGNASGQGSPGPYGQPQGQQQGQPYPGQPSYIPQPPPPKKKRKKWPFILGAVVLLFIIIIAVNSGGGTPSPTGSTGAASAASPGAAAPGTSSSAPAASGVVYEVTGSGQATSISYGSNGGISQENGARLPFTKTAPAQDGFGIYSLTAQTSGSGSISCKITANGKEIANQTSNGQYAVVSCSGSSSPF